jgi:hypothetical protein
VTTYRTLTEDLADLERTDPVVRAAAESYDRMVERVTGHPVGGPPPSTAGSVAEQAAYRSCPYDCGRTVGPYFAEHEARAAIEEHVKWRHVAVRMAYPAQ